MIVYNDIVVDCTATKIHIDLTGGWKSALLLYMCAKDINDNQTSKTSIVPCVIKRINRYNVENMYRPDAIIMVEKQLAWIKHIFPNVKIESIISIDADFWWLPIITAQLMSVDISEKALLRHVYEMCVNSAMFDKLLEFVEDVPMVKSFNAYCKDPDIAASVRKTPYVEKKKYDKGVSIDNNTISLCDGAVIAVQPFADTTKTNLIAIAKELNILDSLAKVTYTCEQSTADYTDPCGVCFNCKQMKRAIENNG
jgi:hypothetical protein